MKINWKRVWERFDLWFKDPRRKNAFWVNQQCAIQRLVNAELKAKAKRKGERKT